MSKFKKGLVGDIKKEQVFEKRQNSLKEKYDFKPDAEVVVVEKSNMVKFSITIAATLIRTLASICVILLASVGLIALIYPNIREELIITWNEIYFEVRNFLPGL